MMALRALALFGIVLSGCATTSGRDWLNSPIEERAQPSTVEVAGAEAPPDARPRLNHTVTLGESYAVAPQRTSAAPSGGSSVHVNVQTPVVVNNYGGGYGYGYSYGYGSRVGSFAPVRATRSAAPSQKVGADFPPVPDYGPPAMR